MKTRLILSALGLLVFSACQSHSSTTYQRYLANQASSFQSARCQKDYFSASASHRSRASSAEFCDVQASNAERTQRLEGRDENLPFDPDEPR